MNNIKNQHFKSLIAQFHKDALTRVKSALGSNCTHIAHVRTKNRDTGQLKYLIEIKLKNNLGGVDTIRYEIQNKTPDDLVWNDYQNLINEVKKLIDNAKENKGSLQSS